MKSLPPHNQTDEQEVIRLICAGEKHRFHQLIQPYERMVFAMALSVTGNDADAEDVAQDAFVKALRHLETFRSESKFSTWLVQITLNEARTCLRRKRAHLYESLDAGQEDEEGSYRPRDFADWRDIPSEALARKELADALRKAVAMLKPIYRQVLLLRDVQQFSVLEAAEALGVSQAVVKTRLLRARLQMRDLLAPGYDGSWTDGAGQYKRVRPW